MLVGETERYDGDASYLYYVWVKTLSIPAVAVSDPSSYECTVRNGQLSNSAVYGFTVDGMIAFVFSKCVISFASLTCSSADRKGIWPTMSFEKIHMTADSNSLSLVVC